VELVELVDVLDVDVVEVTVVDVLVLLVELVLVVVVAGAMQSQVPAQTSQFVGRMLGGIQLPWISMIAPQFVTVQLQWLWVAGVSEVNQ